MIYIAVVVLAGFAWYVMDQKERASLVRNAAAMTRFAHAYATERHPDCEPFRIALAERSARAVVAPAIAIVYVIIGVAVIGGGASDPNHLVALGASFPPVTSTGEWWRLLTSIFVQPGAVALVMALVGFLPVALLLERLAGRLVFATVFAASGVAAAIVSMHVEPVGVTAGASGAILGLYGLLLTTVAGSLVRPSPLAVPLRILSRLAPAALLFLFYLLVAQPMSRAALVAAFATGLVLSVILVRDLGEHATPPRRVGYAAAGAAALILVSAVAVRGISDVRPELARVVAFERTSVEDYDKAVALFTKGRMNAAELAAVIDRRILPGIGDLKARLSSLKGVPDEHKALVASASEYLRLRDESWRLRSKGLHEGNMRRLREADRAEKTSLETLDRIRTGEI